MMNESDVVALLNMAERIGVDVWVDGGWGIDSLVGYQTRPHNDIDIFIEKKNADIFVNLMTSEGYQEIRMEYTTANHTVWKDASDRMIDLHLLEFQGEKLCYDGETYPPSVLNGEGAIGGLTVRCMTAEAQMEFHQGYEHSDKDIQDVLLLCKAFGFPAPDSFREAYINQVTIGEQESHNGEIILEEYNPNWPALFEHEAEKIRSTLGGRALQIHHVGSTSVPGLCAKPIIDIILVIADSSDEPSYAPDLEAAGYTLCIREPDWYEHRLFKGSESDVNLHVFSVNTSEVDRMLSFRDWLRYNNDDKEKYAQAKRELAGRTWSHVQHYADAKTKVIKAIMERALSEN